MSSLARNFFRILCNFQNMPHLVEWLEHWILDYYKNIVSHWFTIKRRLTVELLWTLKFIYSKKATKFCKIFTSLLQSKVRWRFHKILWSSQNIWTLKYLNSKFGFWEIIWIVFCMEKLKIIMGISKNRCKYGLKCVTPKLV